MDAQSLSRDDIGPLLASDDAALLRAVVEVLVKHPDWAEQLTRALPSWLAEPNPSDERLSSARGAVAALIGRSDVQQAVSAALADAKTPKPTRLMLLETVAAQDLAKPPSEWYQALRPNLQAGDADVVRQAVLAATALDARQFSAELLAIGQDTKRSDETRTAAFVAASRGEGPIADDGFGFLVGRFFDGVPVRNRLAAAEALGQFALTAEQLPHVADLIEHCGPLETSWLVRAFERGNKMESGLMLLTALAKSPALASLPEERLREALKNYPPVVRILGKKLLNATRPDDGERAAKIAALENGCDQGDAAKGEELFFGQRALCAACHRIGSQGERIGPELSKIGRDSQSPRSCRSDCFPQRQPGPWV